MELSIVLGGLAPLILVLGYLVYYWSLTKGHAVLYTATWALWSFIAVTNALTYLVMTQDWVKAAAPMGSALAPLAIFIFALFKGRAGKLDLQDKIALIVGIVAVMIWLAFRDAAQANLIVQIAIALSFVPTLRGVWRKPQSENASPWLVWAFGHALFIVTILLRWEGHWVDLAYPINSLVLCVAVAMIVLGQRGHRAS